MQNLSELLREIETEVRKHEDALNKSKDYNGISRTRVAGKNLPAELSPEETGCRPRSNSLGAPDGSQLEKQMDSPTY